MRDSVVSVLLISLTVPKCVTRTTVLFCDALRDISCVPAVPAGWVQSPSPRPEAPPPRSRRWPRPTLLSYPILGQLVLASGGGMGWLSATRQGLFTMADDLEQQ